MAKKHFARKTDDKTTKKKFSNDEQSGDLYSGFVKIASQKLGNDLTDAPINYWLSTGCSLLDWAIKYGVPGGRVTEIYGAEQCISGDMLVAYSVWGPNGRMTPPTEVPLREFFRLYHSLTEGEENADTYITLPSIDGEMRTVNNRVVGVVSSGVKPCFRVKTMSGKTIRATGNHRMYTPTGYKNLEEFNVGDYLYTVDRSYPFGVIGASVVKDEIVNIESSGEEEVYDVMMLAPHHNFVTSDFAVHNSGKTALALSIVRSAQLQGGMGIWLDAEGGFSEELARDIVGVNLEHGWIYRRPFTGEECLDAIEAFCEHAVSAKSSLPVVIVIDSVAGMCSASQTEGEFVDTSRQTGKQASLMSWFFSRPAPKKILGTNVFLIFLNQTRSVLNFYGRPGPPPEDTTPGGKALRFYSTVRIEMSRLKFEEDDSKTKNKTGHIIRAMIKKNKCGIGYREVHFPFYFRPDQPVCGIDDPMALLTYLISRNVMEMKAGGWYVFDGAQHRKKDWRNKMISDETVYNTLREAALKTFLLEHGATSLEDGDVRVTGMITPDIVEPGE